MHTLVIAEAAATHDGDLNRALSLVDLTASIGADVCKFQYCSRAERLVERRGAPESLQAYRLLVLPVSWFEALRARCDEHAVELMVTCYLPEDVDVIARYVRRFKIASFEAEDVPFVALHGCWPAKSLIISSGMGADLHRSLRSYRAMLEASGRSEGDEPPDVAVLHCVSAYPCPDAQANIARIRPSWYMPSPGSGFAGLSDHTRNPLSGALAVAAGARVVEFHVRLDDTDRSNPDFAVARSPEEARAYVRNIREAEVLLGDGQQRVAEVEQPMLRYRVGPT